MCNAFRFLSDSAFSLVLSGRRASAAGSLARIALSMGSTALTAETTAGTAMHWPMGALDRLNWRARLAVDS